LPQKCRFPFRGVVTVLYDSQFPPAGSRFGRDSIQYRVGKTHCQGHQDPSKRVSIFLGGTEANSKMGSIYSVSESILRSRTVHTYIHTYMHTVLPQASCRPQGSRAPRPGQLQAAPALLAAEAVRAKSQGFSLTYTQIGR
jgi:hypothetical protein